ncbi:class I SAM-dependent methyltransferase [Paracrocinitomix mangrovi]|uniref:class I SAM-dependent methyltransferase n=1 Tax=Paracrocinitomix mangrovi TaxID=2862509 RepID=UPI001C8DCA15|nr:class I SAM-dependent methyltransferase [Paracrocinitomix mangrovi]UKN03601.1 class I SAM-dependent methyltransferase [Paracrocinitomix mangrovi]
MSKLFSSHWKDYELLDAGGSKKLERWGKIITIRPDRNAYFKSVTPYSDWYQQADFEFIEESNTKGEWKQLNPNASKSWVVSYKDLKFQLHLTKFKHLGLFPEQQANWDYISQNLQSEDRFLNLFGYTGAASLVAREKGADVFHCDSVKQIISWGRENMELSNLDNIHWVLEDALKFANREVKRGNQYKGIVMDPPAFGIGAKKERWKLEDKFEELMSLALKLRAKNGFIIINTYSPRLLDEDIYRHAEQLLNNEEIVVDTLCLKTTTDKVIEYGQRTLIIA